MIKIFFQLSMHSSSNHVSACSANVNQLISGYKIFSVIHTSFFVTFQYKFTVNFSTANLF